MTIRYAWSDIFPPEEPMVEGPDSPPFGPDHGLHPPAGESEVDRLEERLGVSLPPSYRQFLLFSDGWGVEEYSLSRVGDVAWLRDIEPSTITDCSSSEDEEPWSVSDDLYFVYGEEQLPEHLREEYLPHTLLIGRWDGDLLLNPLVMTPDGEWEAWLLAPWMPGAARYRSFWELAKDRFS